MWGPRFSPPPPLPRQHRPLSARTWTPTAASCPGLLTPPAPVHHTGRDHLPLCTHGALSQWPAGSVCWRAEWEFSFKCDSSAPYPETVNLHFWVLHRWLMTNPPGPWIPLLQHARLPHLLSLRIRVSFRHVGTRHHPQTWKSEKWSLLGNTKGSQC